MRGLSIDDYYLMEHDEEEVLLRMKEREIRQRIKNEQEQIKPYIEALQGVRIVPRSEIPSLFDAAIVANLESGVLGQGINDSGEVVVYRKPFEPAKRPTYQVYELGGSSDGKPKA